MMQRFEENVGLIRASRYGKTGSIYSTCPGICQRLERRSDVYCVPTVPLLSWWRVKFQLQLNKRPWRSPGVNDQLRPLCTWRLDMYPTEKLLAGQSKTTLKHSTNHSTGLLFYALEILRACPTICATNLLQQYSSARHRASKATYCRSYRSVNQARHDPTTSRSRLRQ